MHVSTKTPAGRLTLLAAFVAGLSGSAFAASPDLVISQVYGGGGSANSAWDRDFVEIFNRGSAPVSLKGKSLQYQSAGGTTWNAGPTGALPDVTLQPGQYFLVVGTQVGTGAAIGKFDHAWAPALAAASGKVALANGTANMTVATGTGLIDLVGFGGASHAETAPTPAPSATTSVQRLNDGCTDTDDNSADFIAGAVVGPRHKESTFKTCTPAGPVFQDIVTTCPASLQVSFGSAGSAALSARDGDSIVDAIVIASGVTP